MIAVGGSFKSSNFFDKLINISETWFINDESEDGTSSKTRCKILDGHEMVCIFMESFFDPLELCYILGEKNCDSVDEYVWEFILERYVDHEDWEWVSGYTAHTIKGHIQDTSVLRKLYGSSFCSVSSGYVGLSATQSFSFGIPMIVSKDEPHSPEIEACQAGFNCKFFQTDNVDDLACKLSAFYSEREHFFRLRNQISEFTAENYSFEAMRDTFIQAIGETWEKF